MPQILIREKDRTKAGIGEYANYSVVVPGFVKAWDGSFSNPTGFKFVEVNSTEYFTKVDGGDGLTKAYLIDDPDGEPLTENKVDGVVKYYRKESYFDENGICEFTSKDDFVKKIGVVAPLALQDTEKPNEVYKYDTTASDREATNSLDFVIQKPSEIEKTYTFEVKPTDGHLEFKVIDSVRYDKLRTLCIVDENTADEVELKATSLLQLVTTASGLGEARIEIDKNTNSAFTVRVPVGTTKVTFSLVYNDNADLPDVVTDELAEAGVYHWANFNISCKVNAPAVTVDVVDGNEDEVTETVYLTENEVTVNAAAFAQIVQAEGVSTLEGLHVGRLVVAIPVIDGTITIPGSPAHYGNQMAYELLNLGYKVLYVNMGAFDTKKPEDIRAAIVSLGENEIWAPLRDKASYDYRFIVTGLMNSTPTEYDGNANGVEQTNSLVTKANKAIAALAAFAYDNTDTSVSLEEASVRGDCVALLTLDEVTINKKLNGQIKSQQEIIKAIKYAASKTAPSTPGQYAAIFAPNVCYSNIGGTEAYNYNNKFPASFHYLLCFAKSVFELGYSEWYAIAGMTRGVSNGVVSGTTYNLGELAINALEPRCKVTSDATNCPVSINVIAKIRNSYYLWGNRTAFTLGEEGAENGDLVASHFLNIRQLCTTLKKQIYVACRRFTFDPNSDVLWVNFCNAVKPTLERMKADQGIRDYKIVQVATSQKAKLKARVRIIPIEAVEDFDIEISLEDAFGDVNVSIAE